MLNATPAVGPNGEASVKTAYHCSTLLDNWDEERRQFGQPLQATYDSTTAGSRADFYTTYTTSFKQPTAAQVASAKPPSCFAAEGPRMLLFHHGDIGNIEQYGYATSELALTDRKRQVYTNDEVLDMPGVSSRRHQSQELQRSTGGFCATRSGTQRADGGRDDEAPSPAVQREADFMQSMASTVRSTKDGKNGSTESNFASCGTGDGQQASLTSEGSGNSRYAPPRLLPVGRAAERERLLTTKNVTIDATGAYLFDHVEPYPMTSSKSVGAFVKSCDNPMHKTNLRVHYMEDDY
jgi:hypothetical protein